MHRNINVSNINAEFPRITQIMSQIVISNHVELESVELRDAQYIPIPDALVVFEWAVSQIECSLEILEKNPNDKMEEKWLKEQVDVLNECLSVIPISYNEPAKTAYDILILQPKSVQTGLSKRKNERNQLIKEFVSLLSIADKVFHQLVKVVESLPSTLPGIPRTNFY